MEYKKKNNQIGKSSREVRKITQVEGGYFDDLGFYNLPDGGKSLKYLKFLLAE